MTAVSARDLRVKQEGPIADTPHFVYRAYAENGVLLYVGCTTDVSKRLAEHIQNSRGWHSACWSSAIDLVTGELFPDRAQAREAEAEAIRTERPIFNVQHGTRGDARRRAPIVFGWHESAEVPA